MTNILKLVVALAVTVFLATAGNISASATMPSIVLPIRTEKLSETGETALQQLRRCLAENPVLNVYYLVDTSGSLRDWPEIGFSGSDPNFIRVDLLKENMDQLSSLANPASDQSITINYGLGVFSSDATAEIGWTELNSSNIADQQALLDSKLRVEPNGTTNWPAAISLAQQEFQNVPTPGCDLLVWITDGEIDYGEGAATQQREEQDLANLCGMPVNGVNPSIQPGIFADLRESGVIVIGALLDVTQKSSDVKPWMKSLVEADDGNGRLCGNGKITKYEAAGAFINVTSTKDLVFQFSRLAEVVNGGSDATIGPDGTFTVNPGVTSLKILSQAPISGLSLKSPAGSIPLDKAAKTVGDVTTLSVPITSTNQYGEWKLSGAEDYSNALLLFADIKIKPTALMVNDTNTEGTISVGIDVADEKLQTVDAYDFTLVATTKVDGKTVEVGNFSSAEVRSGDARFTTSGPQQLSEVQFRIKGLTANGQELSDVYRTVDYAVFPSIVTNYDFGVGRGHDPVSGELTFFGPAKGDGYVCTPGQTINAVVIADNAERSDWKATTDAGSSDENGCVLVTQGTETIVPITLASAKSANSGKVELELPLSVKSGTGKASLSAPIDMRFKTEMINNVFVHLAVVSLLILLVLLIPLLVMYIINRLTTKVEHGDDVVRAVIPAQFTTKDDNILVRNAGSYDYTTALDKLDKPQEAFKMQSPQKDAKTISESEVGTFRAVIPLMPFKSPWFEIVAPAGFVALTGQSPTKLQESRYKLGDKAPFNGQVSRTWVALVKEEDLLRAGDDGIEGKLVIFDKRGRGGSERPKQRLLEVQHEAKLSTRWANIRNSIQTSKPKKAAKFTPPPASTTPDIPVPPMPGGSVPGSAPPAPPGAAPRRPGTAKPSGSVPTSPGTGTIPPSSGPGSIPPPPPLPGKR